MMSGERRGRSCSCDHLGDRGPYTSNLRKLSTYASPGHPGYSDPPQ